MKIERQEVEFKPITITIDNEKEFEEIKLIIRRFIHHYDGINIDAFEKALAIRDILDTYND